MPLISSATDASFATTDDGIATITSNNPTAATNALVFMSVTSGANYTAPLRQNGHFRVSLPRPCIIPLVGRPILVTRSLAG